MKYRFHGMLRPKEVVVDVIFIFGLSIISNPQIKVSQPVDKLIEYSLFLGIFILRDGCYLPVEIKAAGIMASRYHDFG